MIRAESLNKVFKIKDNSVDAVKDVNLNISNGEIFGIIGLSGAGKSTLVRLLNRLEEPSSGTIIIDGDNITSMNKVDLRNARKEIGMIFQHFNLLSSRTVAGNIAFPMEISNFDKKQIDNRIDELLDLVGLKDKKYAYPAQLSGGQKQRVAIARALANNPKILLCDEATSALDPKTTNSILNLLKDIRKNLGITIVLITHQMEVIREICDRVAIMENGSIIEEGRVEEVFSNPKTDIAKNFVFGIKPDLKSRMVFPKTPNSVVIKISYVGESSQKPVVSRLIKEYDIDVNIVSGDIDQLMSTSVGHLVIQMLGDDDNIAKAIDALKEQNISTEVIWNG
ncbi:MAG: methionine ABC transporter ATP-binding protein [Andreesenia angusta]|nr:methionine ABC transporter ATP-binding protein [Andreesenia angusta]